MPPKAYRTYSLLTYLFILTLMGFIALWVKSLDLSSSWQQGGIINFSIGFVLLAAFVGGKIANVIHLPLISGYIFVGIIAGPYVSEFLTKDMVNQLRLIDELALNFIALKAGAELHIEFLKERIISIFLNVFFQTVIIIGMIVLFILLSGHFFSATADMTSLHLLVFAILLGVVSIARSPSSAIAIISECRASGLFTDTILGVTVVKDVLVIIVFTFAITLSKLIMTGSGTLDFQALTALTLEIGASMITGAFLGKGIAAYIKRVRHDFTLFLFFLAFAVTRFSLWISGFLEDSFGISMHMEPLLICMAAGFFVQNFSSSGTYFHECLDRMALPIFVLFFSLAGASLDLNSLAACWPLALALVGIRAFGIFSATFISGIINKDPLIHNVTAWMGYLTQAGVAIGLAQLVARKFPEIGNLLITLVMATITVNQVVGPITFKAALHIVGESGKKT